jgi:hypothetical protein
MKFRVWVTQGLQSYFAFDTSPIIQCHGSLDSRKAFEVVGTRAPNAVDRFDVDVHISEMTIPAKRVLGFDLEFKNPVDLCPLGFEKRLMSTFCCVSDGSAWAWSIESACSVDSALLTCSSQSSKYLSRLAKGSVNMVIKRLELLLSDVFFNLTTQFTHGS